MNLNKVHLIGRVTKNPELKTLQSGMAVVSFGLATNNVYTDKQGQKKEETDFHNITAWGKTANTIAQYVVKGQELYVEGRIRYRSWDKQDGSKGYATDIICNTFQFGQKPKNASAPASAPQERPQYGYHDATQPIALDEAPPPSEEDIPF